MTRLEQLQQWKWEAEQARHQLATGRRTVSLSQGDEQITYNKADLAKLDAYIRSLDEEIARLTCKPRFRGPVHFAF